MSSPARLPLGRENYGAMPAFEPFCNLTGHEPTGQNSGMRTLLATLFLSLSGLGRRLDRIEHQLERLLDMSGTLATDLSAQTDALKALATEVSDGLAVNAAAIQALKDQIAAGGIVTPADLATLEGNTKAIQDATNALQATLNPPPAP